jgi:hypothetical protein
MRQPQNARGSKQKISDEKRGHSKMQGAQNKRPPMKKIGNPKMQGAQNKRPPMKKRQPLTGKETENLELLAPRSQLR